MTYHMENMASKKLATPELGEVDSLAPRVTERRVLFPERLWECVNDTTDLIKWSPTGDSVIVDAGRFENEVMSLYPGLVAISSFANFRRQLRVYNFECFGCEEEELEFQHPDFIRGHPELVCQIQTRRRTGETPVRVRRARKITEEPGIKREKDGSNVEEEEVKSEGPKRKRRYMRRKPKSPLLSRHSMPHSRFHPSGRFGGDNRPPAGPFCYCPMHCPVTWDAYEAMMQEWTKGAPPPGYWYPPHPPPLHQPPPPVGLSEDQQDATKGRDETAGDEIVDREKEEDETQSSEGTTADQTEPFWPQMMGAPMSPNAYPIGPDPWRLHQPMGAGTYYPLMPYGAPTIVGPQGHQPYPNHYHPQMSYPYPMPAVPPVGQQLHGLAKQKTPEFSTKTEENKKSESAEESVAWTTITPENSTPSSQTENFQTIDEQMMKETLESNDSTKNMQQFVSVTKPQCVIKPEYAHQVAVGENHVTIIQPYTPTRSTIPEYLRKRRASKCKTGPQPEAVDKPPDQVSTEQLITNVGIQQHNVMTLINQHQQDDVTYEPAQGQHQHQHQQVWSHDESYHSSSQNAASIHETVEVRTWQQPQQHELQTWHQQQQHLQDQQSWQQHQLHLSQGEHSPEAAPGDAEHWVEQQGDAGVVMEEAGDADVMDADDVMLEVEVASQDSQCSGPLDLSSAEVTIVTMDRNIPVKLAAVVQDDE